jgi:phosphoadenosine phosphosulfate reductase
MITGEYPHRCTTVRQRFILLKENIFEIYKERGYNTYVFTGLPWFSTEIGTPTGVDVVVDKPITPRGTHLRKNKPFPLFIDCLRKFNELKREPYIAWFQIADTHQPFITHNQKEPKVYNYMKLSNVHKKHLERNNSPLPYWEDKIKNIYNYQKNAVQDMDELLIKLSKEDADIIVTADHGDNYDYKQPYGHGYYFMNDFVVHVPLCVRSENTVGNSGDVISLKEIPKILDYKTPFQDFAYVEYPYVNPKRIFTAKSSYMFVTNNSSEYVEIPTSEEFPESLIDTVDIRVTKKTYELLGNLTRAKEKYDNIGFATATGKNSSVMLYFASKIFDKLNLLFVDTGLHFDETMQTLEKFNNYYNSELFIGKYRGERNFEIGSTECCATLKAKPFNELIEKENFDGVMTAIRRTNPAWENETLFSHRTTNTGYEYDRIHPVIDYSESDIWSAIRLYHIPINPLYAQGFRSLDCEPCTEVDPTSERAGRNPQKEKKMKVLRDVFGYM